MAGENGNCRHSRTAIVTLLKGIISSFSGYINLELSARLRNNRVKTSPTYNDHWVRFKEGCVNGL